MRYAVAISFLLLMYSAGAAEEIVTAGQLLAKGFEVRASFFIEKGAPVLVLQKGSDAFLCELIEGEYLALALASMSIMLGQPVKPLPAVGSVCAQLK